jgi:solute carrier family 36 (proton-coupled amino acid transporter)
LIYVFQDMPEFTSMKAVNDNIIENFPLYFGTVLFALEAVGVVIALENNMKTPKSFGGVMNIGMTLVTAMYGFVGFFGYGEQSKDAITLSLPNGW